MVAAVRALEELCVNEAFDRVALKAIKNLGEWATSEWVGRWLGGWVGYVRVGGWVFKAGAYACCRVPSWVAVAALAERGRRSSGGGGDGGGGRCASPKAAIWRRQSALNRCMLRSRCAGGCQPPPPTKPLSLCCLLPHCQYCTHHTHRTHAHTRAYAHGCTPARRPWVRKACPGEGDPAASW
jgi:hypothetical protein